jgi:effector-binding domain-containing protein
MAAWIRAEAGEEAFAGPPFARYYSLDPTAVDVEAVFPLTRAVAASGRMRPVILDEGEAAQVLYVGPYEAIEAWLTVHDKKASEPIREIYLTDPVSEPDPSNWRTLVVQPYR